MPLIFILENSERERETFIISVSVVVCIEILCGIFVNKYATWSAIYCFGLSFST